VTCTFTHSECGAEAREAPDCEAPRAQGWRKFTTVVKTGRVPDGRAEPLSADLNTADIVERIRRRFETAGDNELELYPAPEDLTGVLTYMREHEHVLRRELERAKQNLDQAKRRKGSASTRRAAQERLKKAGIAWRDTWGDQQLLIRRQRQLLDVEEDFGIDAARWGRKARTGRDSWMRWEDLAEKQGVESANGARERSKRLKLALKSKWQVRTPRIAQAMAAEEAAAEHRNADKYEKVRRAAHRLFQHRHQFVADEDVRDLRTWWDDLASDFLQPAADGQELTQLQKAAARVHLQVIVDELRLQAVEAGVRPAQDDAARQALNEAVEAVRSE
jgi:hypothetical protein